MPKAYGYIRVSSEEQAESGLSLEGQAKTLDRYFDYIKTKIDYEDMERGGFFREEGVSAFKRPLLKRPEGAALNTALEPGDHVLFVRLDRGFRDTRDFLNTWSLWEKRGINAHFLDINVDVKSPNGELFVTIMAAMARWESRVKSERTKAALDVLKKSGKKYSCNAPLGWTHGSGKDKNMIPDVEMVKMMLWIVDMRDKHGKTWVEISDAVEDKFVTEGKITKRRVRWSRPWKDQRCARAYKAWKKDDKLRERVESGGVV